MSGEPTISEWMPPVLQCANLLFLASAVWSDVLLIRLCLSGAFVCLLLQCVLSATDGLWIIDGFFWATAIGLFHWYASISMVREELRTPAAFPDPDDEALFCFLHRRTGIERSDCSRLLHIGSWIKHPLHALVCDTEEARNYVHLLVDGSVDVQWHDEEVNGQSASGELMLGSGECFDLRTLNLCGVFIGFPNVFFHATATRPTLVFRIRLLALSELLQDHPQLLGFLRTFTLNQLAIRFQCSKNNVPERTLPFDSFGDVEEEEWHEGARSRDFSGLSETEARSLEHTCNGLMKWIWASFTFRVPPGCRHESNPYSGSLAQAEVISRNLTGLTDLKKRKVAAGASKQASAPLMEGLVIETSVTI
eukprot:TRINITY_DN14522_c0_g1_i1.p1 TRINITY_DN14522_c0_g1~~TRINITY_DN14522_c0_g1_i1.p1  ORF type:complete len:364 (+),score=71.62 TRINITY_DN14522_c0_g1_i1:119-1210(+)